MPVAIIVRGDKQKMRYLDVVMGFVLNGLPNARFSLHSGGRGRVVG